MLLKFHQSSLLYQDCEYPNGPPCDEQVLIYCLIRVLYRQNFQINNGYFKKVKKRRKRIVQPEPGRPWTATTCAFMQERNKYRIFPLRFWCVNASSL